MAAEREVAREIINALTDEPVYRERFAVRVIDWSDRKAGVPLLYHLKPQQSIDQGLAMPRDCDIIIVLLGARMGTPHTDELGRGFLSGTHYELVDGIEASHRRMVVYKSAREPEIADDDEEARNQWKSLQGLLNSELFARDGPVAGINLFSDADDLREMLSRDLKVLVEDWLHEREQPAAATAGEALGGAALSPTSRTGASPPGSDTDQAVSSPAPGPAKADRVVGELMEPRNQGFLRGDGHLVHVTAGLRGINVTSFDEEVQLVKPFPTDGGLVLTRDGTNAVYLNQHTLAVTELRRDGSSRQAHRCVVPDGFRLLSAIRRGRHVLRCLLTDGESSEVWDIHDGSGLRRLRRLDLSPHAGVFVSRDVAWVIVNSEVVVVDLASETSPRPSEGAGTRHSSPVRILAIDHASGGAGSHVALLTADNDGHRRLRITAVDGSSSFSHDLALEPIQISVARDVRRSYKDIIVVTQDGKGVTRVHQLALS